MQPSNDYTIQSATVRHPPVRAYAQPRPRPKQINYLNWMLGGALVMALLTVITIGAILAGGLVMYSSGRILPAVSSGGVSLGGMTTDDATAQLAGSWAQIKVRDGQRTWIIPPSQLGISLDARATALAAQRYGREDGSLLSGVFGQTVIQPVLVIDPAKAAAGIKSLTQMVELPAANATIRMVNGQLAPVAAIEGRLLDIPATTDRLLKYGAGSLPNGVFDLVMDVQSPTVTDASALLEKTRALLASPLVINAYDAISNKATTWSIPPEQWGQWLTTENGPTGITPSLNAGNLNSFLSGQASTLTDGATIDLTKGVDKIRAAVAAGQATTTILITHKPTAYVVRPGDTLGTLSWKFGMPMFRFINANPNINMDSLSVGQTITVPSKDEMLPLPIVMNKRVVVSISRQHMWVYENGQIKWDWVASTGIADSPTMPGVFQIQSHEKNAYAGNWNLWMPYFMGIYDAVPGFTNGIHGFPTRNGYGILWEGSLGHPVTYGCILLSTTNSLALFNWAEDGVVVEIQP